MDKDWRPVLDRIDDVIAEDVWDDDDGHRCKLIVGRPAQVPADAGKPHPTWYCPVYIESIMPRIRPIYGGGPVDALMNAMTLVRSYFHDFYGLDQDETAKRLLSELKNSSK
jgi:hypothetical protein